MPKITIEQIQRRVADQFGLEIGELKTRNNARAVVVPRHIAMYLTRELTDASLPQIGRQFGGMHHTTVMYAIQKIADKQSRDPGFTDILNMLERCLKEALL